MRDLKKKVPWLCDMIKKRQKGEHDIGKSLSPKLDLLTIVMKMMMMMMIVIYCSSFISVVTVRRDSDKESLLILYYTI